jgi:tRNA/tmRNA/rRNA uracil-C5-methylase (TrmA/RlmC/RlmD family)
MQVKELIEMLGYMDQEAEVHFAYNYGDHWRTQVAPKVDNVEQGVVEYSSYHSMDKIVDDEDCYDEETGDYKEDVRKVVVLG